MSITPTDLQSAIDHAAALAATLRVARALAASGRRIDLSGLDRDAGLLCARALDLPAESGRALRPHLRALLAEHDALARALATPCD